MIFSWLFSGSSVCQCAKQNFSHDRWWSLGGRSIYRGFSPAPREPIREHSAELSQTKGAQLQAVLFSRIKLISWVLYSMPCQEACHATCLDQPFRTSTTAVQQPRQTTQILHNLCDLFPLCHPRGRWRHLIWCNREQWHGKEGSKTKLTEVFWGYGHPP